MDNPATNATNIAETFTGGCPCCGSVGPADLYDDGSMACFSCGYIFAD